MNVGPYTLHAHQERAVNATRSKLASLVAQGKRGRVLAVGPPGVGKTIFSTAIMSMALAKRKSSLFIVSGRVLVDQKSAKLRNAGIRHGVLMAGRESEMEGYRNIQSIYPQPEVIVASKDTYYSRSFVRETIDRLQPDLVIVDEAHVGGDSWTEIIEAHGKIPVIGLTATPCKGNGQSLKGWDSIVEIAGYGELIRDGFLVPCRVFAPYSVDMSGGKRSSSTGDWSQQFVESRFDKPELVGDVVANWKKFGGDRPTVCFASGVGHSIHLKEEFIRAGIPAAHIDATTPDDEREEIYNGIKSGDISVVVNYGVLVQGVDIPILSCGILAFATGSIVKALQVPGRLFRTAQLKTDAIIIDHGGNVYRHGWPQSDREWDLDSDVTVQAREEKRRAAEGKPREPICCPKCSYVRDAGPVCPNCNYRHTRNGHKVLFSDGSLKEVKERSVKKYVKTDDQKLWSRCLGIAAHRDMSVVQAKILFQRYSFGKWPTNSLYPWPAEHQERLKVVDLYPWFYRRRHHVDQSSKNDLVGTGQDRTTGQADRGRGG